MTTTAELRASIPAMQDVVYLNSGWSGPSTRDVLDRVREVMRAGKDLIRLVREAIMRLPDHYREVVILRDLQGLSYEEITDLLGIPGGTVRSRINRARIELQTRLRPLLANHQLGGQPA